MSDNIESRIFLDADSVYEEINQVLDTVSSIYANKVLARAMGEKTIAALRENSATVKSRLHDQFQLVVVGDFKRGKSTLINAILGENIVPTAVTPETVTINRLSFAEEPSTIAVLKNKHRVILSQEELPREALEELIRRLPAEIDHIDILRNNPLLREITLVDTPGLGDLMQAFDQQVADYLIHADAVIYVISARSPLSATEEAFLSSAIMPQNFARVFLVVNMCDTLETPENIDKIRLRIQNRAAAVSDKIYVHMLSGLDEYCRRLEKKRPEPELSHLLEENFRSFTADLHSDILAQKEIIKTGRGITLTRQLLSQVAAHIRLTQKALQESVGHLEQVGETLLGQDERLGQRIAAHKESLAADIDAMAAEAKNWLTDFLSRVQTELSNTGRTMETADLQRHLQFYLTDMIKEGVNCCLQKHRRKIADQLAGYSRAVSEDLTKDAFGAVQQDISGCIVDISWTEVDAALYWGELAASYLGGVFSQVMSIGYVVAGFFRQRTIARRQNDLITPVIDAFPEIISRVLAGVDEIYCKMKLEAQMKLNDLYQSQRELSAEAIENARRAAADENTRVQDILQEAEEALEAIQACQRKLEAYR